jgi:hypothetical protein
MICVEKSCEIWLGSVGVWVKMRVARGAHSIGPGLAMKSSAEAEKSVSGSMMASKGMWQIEPE